MKKPKISINPKYKGVLKGVLFATVFTVLCVLGFALVLKMFTMGDGLIPYFNQVVKIISILIAAYYGKKHGEKMYFGAVGALAYMVVSYLLFSLIAFEFGSPMVLISDLIMSGIIGMIFSYILNHRNEKSK